MAGAGTAGRGRGRRAALVLVALTAVAVGAWRVREWLAGGPLGQGRAAYGRGDWGKASAEARERLTQSPDDREALRLLARASARQGLDDSALSLFRRLGPDQMAAEDYFLVGVGLFRRNQNELALGALERAQALDPGHADTIETLARFHLDRDHLVEAERLARKLAGLPGKEARGQFLLSQVRSAGSDPAGAAEALGQALKSDPDLSGSPTPPAEARKLFARALLQTGKPVEARAQLDAVLGGKKDDPEAAWLLSRAFLQEGKAPEAEAALKRSGDFGDEHQPDEPAAYVGAARCAGCHKDVHRSQRNSLHAKTFTPTNELKKIPLPDGPLTDPDDPKVAHTIRWEGDQLVFETRRGGESRRAKVVYGLGSGDRGLTLVGLDGKGVMRELHMSRYNDGTGWDRTTGHPRPPKDLDNFLGREVPPDGLRMCLNCHTTNFRAATDRLPPIVNDHSVGCERCHGPGGNHVKAVESKFPDLAVARPQLYSADRVLKLCGQCHSPREDQLPPPGSPSLVRFQAASLVKSRCYTESAGAFSCLTCHNPHRDADPSPASYEAKCLSCHTATKKGDAETASPAEGFRRVPCPVNATTGCLSCHMPTVKGVVPHSPFTDHYVRIHRDGEGR